MKTLYYFGCSSASSQIFVSSEGEFVSFCCYDDGEYRDEYHSFIAEYFGGQIKYLDFDLEPQEGEDYIDCGDIENILKTKKKELLKAIKNAK